MASQAVALVDSGLATLRIGQLLEIHGNPGDQDISSTKDLNGEIGQLQEIHAGDNRLDVMMMESGEVVSVDGKFARPATVGSSDCGFDIVVGPRTDRHVLMDTLKSSLSDKGYCVLRVLQREEDRKEAFQSMQQADAEGLLGRLAQEVEEGYLGKGGRAKSMWMDPDMPGLPWDGAVCQSDHHLTLLAELMEPCAQDVLGVALAERSPALVCMSMNDSQEQEYESCQATDRMIEEYYGTWSRTAMRAISFLGPGTGVSMLNVKKDAPSRFDQPPVEIAAAPGTIILFREDAFEYSYEEPPAEDACWLISFFLKAAPNWDFGELEGDLDVFETPINGPPPPKSNQVAVVSMSIQCAGAMNDHHAEWCAYMAGVDGQREMPFARFDYLPYYNPDTDTPHNTTFVKHFAVQEGIELFDNKFFEISNMEATALDPQCRQVLEVGYLSIAQLGYTKKWCNTNPLHASVSVGMDKQEWLSLPGVPTSVATNNQQAIMANRFNYAFNLKGGSYVMDTACSSSLCAMHLGKVNLLERRWDPLEWHLGLGTALTLSVGSFVHSCAAHMLSPGGRCFTFNATANGYNRGDGTAALMLKAGPHEDERWAYCRGSQIGQDGRSASMSAPNGPAQEKCIWGALREGQMDPPESTVWECHGTGTSLGDPIEVGAVRRVQIKMKRLEPLMIASSKSNLGHLEGSAAAIAMNKCILVVMHVVCAPTQHLNVLNPHLEHSTFDAFFTTEPNPYLYNSGHCQVSSFGVGGTNGHAIFWGERHKPKVDHKKAIMQKLISSSMPIVVIGNDPAEWEYSGPPYTLKPGEKCKLVYSKDPLTGDDEIRYETVQTVSDQPIEYYCTTGNHNDWMDDRMEEGDTTGLFYQDIEMPRGGTLEFRLLAEGDQDRSIGPDDTSKRMTSPIVGPSADVRTSWIVDGQPGVVYRVQFFAPPSSSLATAPLRSVSWMPLRES